MKYGDYSLGRLREAREARGLSLDDLAKKLGVTRQVVYKYEHGLFHPRPDTIARLCTVLRIPPVFFLQPSPEPELNPIFLRHFKSKTSTKYLTAANRQLRWAQQFVTILDEHVVLPEVNFPNFFPPSDPREIPNEKIEQSATALRRHWKLGDGVIPNVIRLVENNGCIVIRQIIDCETIDAFSQWTINGRPFIIIDCRKVSSTHRRFDVAHELGHLVLHRSLDKRFVEANADTHRLIEEQAFRFAGAFLLPEITFRHTVPYVTLDTLLLAKPQWRASVAAMLRRARDLDMVDTEMAKRYWINRTRRGWQKGEPFDDQIPFEEPQVLANALRALKDSDSEEVTRLCADVGLYGSDIARYAGLNVDELEPDAAPDFPITIRGVRNLRAIR